MIKKIVLGVTLFFIAISGYGYDLKQVDIKSKHVNKTLSSTIVLPDSYAESDAKYPTIYVLHGWSGDYQSWVKKSDIAKLADQYQVILVMPDGDYDKWYIDSPVNKNSQFESFITKELIPTIDKNYATLNTKNGRAITGLSMGGFGALNLAVNYQDLFGAVGSMSGGVDPRDFAKNWGLENVFGDRVNNANYWDSKAIINNAHHFIFSNIDIIIDCGVGDFFIESNRKLHQKLIELRIPHDYIERDGGHTWNYWNNSIQYQMLFLTNALKNKK